MLDNPITTRVFAPLILVLGLAMILRTVVEGGGPLSSGVILGVLFAAFGGLRLWAAAKRKSPSDG